MEGKLFKKGNKKILAIDEVGRGSLAGPFYVGGLLITQKDYKKLKKLSIKDSKKLSPSKRELIFNLLKKCNLQYKIIKFSNKQIDKKGIGKCFIEGIIKLYSYFRPNYVLIDGKEIKILKGKLKNIEFIVNGDNLLISIGAISIICKILRDNYMIKLSKKINFYQFEKNKGYGTTNHLKKIKKYGISIYHRQSFIHHLNSKKHIVYSKF